MILSQETMNESFKMSSNQLVFVFQKPFPNFCCYVFESLKWWIIKRFISKRKSFMKYFRYLLKIFFDFFQIKVTFYDTFMKWFQIISQNISKICQNVSGILFRRILNCFTITFLETTHKVSNKSFMKSFRSLVWGNYRKFQKQATKSLRNIFEFCQKHFPMLFEKSIQKLFRIPLMK